MLPVAIGATVLEWNKVTNRGILLPLCLFPRSVSPLELETIPGICSVPLSQPAAYVRVGIILFGLGFGGASLCVV